MMGPTESHFGFSPPPLREEMETLPLSDGPLASVSTVRGNAGGDPLLHPFHPDSPSSSSPSSPTSTFPDPPSYAEAVSFHAADPPKDPPSPRWKSGEDSDYLKITVSDPQKESEPTVSLVPGAGTFVSYLITTRTRAADLSGSPQEFNVRRRFRDFVTLADRIAESYRGFIIPPRPDKSVVESQVMHKHEFVEQRRSALEKYLYKLASHPMIGNSDELRIFLQAPGKFPLPATTDMASRVLDGAARLPKQLFSAGEAGSGYVAAPQEVVQPAKGGRDLLRMFKELKQSVTNDWGGAKPSLVEEDRAFLERKERVLELEQQLSAATQQAEGMVKSQQDMSETMGELGLAFFKLGKFETEEALYDSQKIRAADFKHLATAAVRASRAYRESNSMTMKHLDKLHEFYGLMLAVRNAFSDRSSALVTLQTVLSDLSTLHSREENLEAASSKIFGGEKTRTRKLEELKETIRITEDAKNIALREYERIKENNRSELDRLDGERHEDFLTMIKGFVINQIRAECDCGGDQPAGNRSHAIPLKLGAIFSILAAGFVGVTVPTAGKRYPELRPGSSVFFTVKAFAAGVILATGFVHILPDAFDSLTSPCLGQRPWQDFPFAGFVAMAAAIGTMVVDTVATGYYSRVNERKARRMAVDDEEAAAAGGGDGEVVAVHAHATNGHAHGSAGVDAGDQLLRHRVISQVLELGIVVHSVIIGISLGASDTPSTIRPLVAALSFHQLFEGIGLGGCLLQAELNLRSMITMVVFFCMTTPVGIAIGIGISSVYNENSPTALIVQGILNSGAAGILICMALVDLIAADLMNPKVQENIGLQVVIYISLLLGAGSMSLIAKWA